LSDARFQARMAHMQRMQLTSPHAAAASGSPGGGSSLDAARTAQMRGLQQQAQALAMQVCRCCAMFVV